MSGSWLALGSVGALVAASALRSPSSSQREGSADTLPRLGGVLLLTAAATGAYLYATRPALGARPPRSSPRRVEPEPEQAALDVPEPAGRVGPLVVARLEAPPNEEASGLAASRQSPGLLWLHDDSGGRPEVHAVDLQGRLRGTVRLDGVSGGDWEDLAVAEIDGRSYLAVADTGDNDAKRSRVQVRFVAEPGVDRLTPASPVSVRPSATLKITYADGPRDCESVAFDARERALYLLSKRDPTPRLYRVEVPAPLRDAEVVARPVGEVPRLPQRGKRRSDGRVLSWPTAMDFSPDGSMAAVLTYTSPVLFPRQPNESWASALAREPVVLPPHALPQAEALAFSADGRSLFVASEKTRNLVRYDLPTRLGRDSSAR